jgi:hypothetical protein
MATATTSGRADPPLGTCKSPDTLVTCRNITGPPSSVESTAVAMAIHLGKNRDPTKVGSVRSVQRKDRIANR